MTAIIKQVPGYVFLCGLILSGLFAYYPNQPNQKNNPYKQIRIPLDIKNGVPFSKDIQGGGYYTEGFDIDSNGNYYFLGGRNATLACFSKYGAPIFRKTYLNLAPAQICIVGGKLFFFEIGQKGLNTLVEIDKSNGLFIDKYSKTIATALKEFGCKSIRYYSYGDSSLGIICADSQNEDDTKALCFSFKGKLLSNCNTSVSAAVQNDKSYGYLGKLGDKYVVGKFDDDGKKYDLSLRDSLNATIADAFLERKFLGEALPGDIQYILPEHIRVRYNKLYTLYRDKNMAVITEVDLANIFHIK